jgi:thioesterase domain-containing protein
MAAKKIFAANTPRSAIGEVFSDFRESLNTFYSPAMPYSGTAVLIRASHEGRTESLASRWRRHVPGLRIVAGPGTHVTMLQSPHVAALAQLVLEEVGGF